MYTFALILGQLCATTPTHIPSSDRLQYVLFNWELSREARLSRVLELNRQMDLRRMPAPLGSSGKDVYDGKAPMNLDFDWLFQVDFNTVVMKCMGSANL